MRGVSVDFQTELGRHNYVTPTSYLELITMFQRLLTAKRVENSKTLSRYTVGLDKLQSSAEQVAGMQQELRVCSTLPLLFCSDTGLHTMPHACCIQPCSYEL